MLNAAGARVSCPAPGPVPGHELPFSCHPRMPPLRSALLCGSLLPPACTRPCTRTHPARPALPIPVPSWPQKPIEDQTAKSAYWWDAATRVWVTFDTPTTLYWKLQAAGLRNLGEPGAAGGRVGGMHV